MLYWREDLSLYPLRCCQKIPLKDQVAIWTLDLNCGMQLRLIVHSLTNIPRADPMHEDSQTGPLSLKGWLNHFAQSSYPFSLECNMSREVFLHSVIVSVSKTAAYSEPFTVSEQLEGRKGFILHSILLCKHVKGRVCKIGGNTIYMRILHTNGGQFFIFASGTRHYHGSNCRLYSPHVTFLYGEIWRRRPR